MAVEQLQGFLSELGYLGSVPDGEFEGDTERAVRSWQRDLGMTADGVVRSSDIVWLPELPAQVRLGAEVTLGARARSAEPAVVALARQPTFAAVVTQSQALVARAGTRVTITGADGHHLEGVVVELRSSSEDPTGVEAIIEVDPTLCGEVCESVAIEGISYLSGLVHTVPAEEGLTVPTAAIRTSADGRTFVRGEDGSPIPVSVVQSARGLSLIEGLNEGVAVRIDGMPDE